MEKDDRLEINHPKRYNADTPYECYKVLRAWMTKEQFQGYLRGNCLKYLCRVGKKDDEVQELGKCKWYLEKLIESFQDIDKSEEISLETTQDVTQEDVNNLIMTVKSNSDFNSVNYTWKKKQPRGVSKSEHYHTFLDILKDMLGMFILKYNLVPNTLIVNPRLFTVIGCLDSFDHSKYKPLGPTGPGYVAGKLNIKDDTYKDDEWLDIIVDTDNEDGKFFMLNNSRPEFITVGKLEEE